MASDSESPALEPASNPSSCAGKTNKGKVPKRVHKAEREKMKREHLNDLFLDLANAIELGEQNNGKASTLTEATKLLRDLLAQIESLKKENLSLLSESHYVTMEKNELEEENSALETQIEKLQGEIEAKVAQSKPDLNAPPPMELQSVEHTATLYSGECLQLPTVESTLQQGPAVLVVPFQPHLQPSFPAANFTELTSKSIVSKPHARYPTPADSWPSQLLGEQPILR